MSALPNFFIVGAPKCGTTAMDRYLAAHPDIFISTKKELHYFATDLKHPGHVTDAETYAQFFSTHGNEKMVGESSVNYLYSSSAAQNIHEFDSNAKIIIMLRNQVEMVPSLHAQLLWNGSENVKELKRALELEEKRKKGEHIPGTCPAAYELFYLERAKYAAQVKRYMQQFDKANIHVILFEDLKKDPKRTYENVLAFLGIDQTVTIDFKVINANKTIRSQFLRKLLSHDNTMPIKQYFRGLVPKKIRNRITTLLKNYNTKYEKREPIDESLKRFIRDYFRDDNEELGRLIGRDLSHWSRDEK